MHGLAWISAPRQHSESIQERITDMSLYSGVIQCTQKGHIRLTSVLSADPSNDAGDNCKTDTHTCNVPMGIRHFKATHSGAQFAYAGKEVNLSLWNTELAFASGKQSAKEHIVKASKKRGRESLFPGEIWRAKNVGALRTARSNVLTR